MGNLFVKPPPKPRTEVKEPSITGPRALALGYIMAQEAWNEYRKSLQKLCTEGDRKGLMRTLDLFFKYLR